MERPEDEPSVPTFPFIRVFGTVGMEGADGPLSIGGPRQRRLLALLALRADTVVDIDWLAEYLWDDEDRPEATAPSLRTAVSRLRSSFPTSAREWIVTESEGYRLAAPPEAVEHRRFSLLRAQAAAARKRGDYHTADQLLGTALELWRGDPFRELADLEPAQAQIERLRLDRLDMMEERWEAALALGRHTQITGELAAFAAEHAERDRAVRQYALALHRSGQTTESLRVVREHIRVLVEEFGLDPSAEIAQLERQLLDDDPALAIESDDGSIRGYRLGEEIGVGSFAIVWRGVQPSVGREVAIKQIRSELATQPAFIRRFEAEAHLVARIEHPHIVPLIDYWREPDSAYLVMRWLRGGTLERRLDDGPLTLAETLEVARQIGGALAAAHGHGVIHRDVRTANILFDEAGYAFLTDFGIALEAAETSGPEAALSPGTPAYSSPEQIRQEPLGPASDVFSLGVVLFECLSGTLPFSDAAAAGEVVERQLTEPYPKLSELRDDVPDALAGAIARATAKDPAERFASVADFVATLDAALAPSGTVAEPSARVLVGQPDNPFQGLLAFDDTSADRFFGRERLVAELVARLSGSGIGSRCVVLVGPSGSGKSSVARAGLLPAVRDGAVPGSADWYVTSMTPGDDPFESLEAALLRVAVDPPPTLLAQLGDGPRGILRSVRRCLPHDGQRLLLLLDQLEELFVGHSRQDADEFLEALTVAVTDPTSPLRLVTTLRADYYGQPLAHPAFAPVLDAATVNVTPLAGDELERAIVEPARALGLSYEPGLVARIAAETTGLPSPLPLLQYTLAELFERRDGATLTSAAYDLIGGLSGALASRAEAIHGEADAEQQEAIRRLFGRLIDPAEETADLRRRARLADLGESGAMRWVLERFGEARLITFDRDLATREPTVEVAHEALLREWPRLVRWLETDRELLREVTRLDEAVTRWVHGGRRDEDLLRGARLERATELTATAPAHLRAPDLELIAASARAAQVEREAQERSQRRLRLLVGGLAAAFAIALVAGGLALVQLNRADDEARAARAAQERAELTTLLLEANESDPATAILLALEAQRRDPSSETDTALLDALTRAGPGRASASYDALPADDCSGAWPGWFARDGTYLTAASEGTAVTRDLETGEVTERFEMPDEACGDWYGDPDANVRYAVSEGLDRIWLGPFEGDWEHELRLDGGSWVSGADGLAGSRLLLESRSGISLVDTETGTRVGAPLFGLDEDPVAALSDDGWLAAISTPSGSTKDRAGTVSIIGTADGSELSRTPVDGEVTALHFRRDSSGLFAGTSDGRLVSIDAANGEVTAEAKVGEAAVTRLGSAADGRVLATLEGDPPGVALFDEARGRIRASMEVGGRIGAVLREDGTLIAMDEQRRIDVLESAEGVLEAGTIDLSGVEDLSPDDFVRIDNGIANIMRAQRPDPVAVRLATGELLALDLPTPEGGRFAPIAGPMLFEDGHAAISGDLEVALWRDGEMVDRVDLGDDPLADFDGSDYAGSRLLVGVRSPAGDLRLHLLEMLDGSIEQVLELEYPDQIFRTAPLAGDELLVMSIEGVVQVFGGDGQVVDAYDVGIDPTAGRLEASFDGAGRAAFARPNPSRGTSQVDVVERGGERTHAFSAPGEIVGLRFARDGALLVLKAADGSVRLHDLETGVTSDVVWDGADAPFGVPWYDAESETVWLASSDRLTQLHLSGEGWRGLACQRVGRELSPEEWDRLVPGDGPQV
ncbi:MAG: protein kinase, partial [Candidatus Limnocylindrales bacterium]